MKSKNLFRKSFFVNNPLTLQISPKELEDIVMDFIWHFNGSNNAKFLLENECEIYNDVLYDRYKSELEKLIKFYELTEFIEEADYLHNWFSNWKNLDFHTKEEFINKIKTDENFSNVWGDMGINDSLELRNWGIQINFDNQDNASIKKNGKDQLIMLLNSLNNNPSSGFHILNFYNVSNIDDRIIVPNLLNIEFYCNELTYEERVKWFFINYYETGMEYEILLDSFKKENLDKIKFYDEIIKVPKYSLSSSANYRTLKNRLEYNKALIFNNLFLNIISKYSNMIPENFTINSTLFINPKNNKKLEQNINLKILKEDFNTLFLRREEIKII